MEMVVSVLSFRIAKEFRSLLVPHLEFNKVNKAVYHFEKENSIRSALRLDMLKAREVEVNS